PAVRPSSAGPGGRGRWPSSPGGASPSARWTCTVARSAEPLLLRGLGYLVAVHLRVHADVVQRPRDDGHGRGTCLGTVVLPAAEVSALPRRQQADDEPDGDDDRGGRPVPHASTSFKRNRLIPISTTD